MAQGKPAGMACAQLDADLQCRIFGQPARPDCCSGLRPSPDMCGSTREHALHWLQRLETLTRPN